MTSLFDKLAAEEEEFFQSEFLSPVLKGSSVRVRISGIILEMKIQPRNFEGWGIFKCIDQKHARFVKEPTLSQKEQYLQLYPKFSVVVCQRGDSNFGVLADQSDKRFKVSGLIPISLPEDIELFDTIDVRYDGKVFWYDCPSGHRGVKMASDLRDKLREEVEPDDVVISKMTKEELMAYRIAFLNEIEAKKDRKEERIKSSLERGGAVFRSYMERGSTYSVEFEVDGEVHNSVVDRDTFQVSNAGICLNGTDQEFDLQSLVGVIREGYNRDLIYRM